MSGIRIGPLWVHRREQWDLDCHPIVCVHWKRPNRTTRVLCVWFWGLQIRPVMVTRKAISIGRRYWHWKRG